MLPIRLARIKHVTAITSQTKNKMSEQPKLTRNMSRRFYRFESLAEQLAEVLGSRQQSDPNLWVFEVSWEVANKGKCAGGAG